jgi:ribosomal protein L7/L12
MSLSEVEQLITNNEHLAAIKRYQKLNKCSLPVAKSNVEHFRDTGVWPAEQVSSISELTEVEKLVQEEKMLEAIKLYRQLTSKNLALAKVDVEHFRDTGVWKQISDNPSQNREGRGLPNEHFQELAERQKKDSMFKGAMILLVVITAALIISTLVLLFSS